MGLKYLWDTNAIIYYLQNEFSSSANEKRLDRIINKEKPNISVISEIELLCWRYATEGDILMIKDFIKDCKIFELDNDLKNEIIRIRKIFNLKLPDAVIAATALVNNLALISHNSKDFQKIDSLKILDPFSTR